MREIGNWLILIPMLVVLFFAWFWFLMFVLGFAALFAVAWVFGVPFKITQNGQKIGYVRWFTFHRY